MIVSRIFTAIYVIIYLLAALYVGTFTLMLVIGAMSFSGAVLVVGSMIGDTPLARLLGWVFESAIVGPSLPIAFGSVLAAVLMMVLESMFFLRRSVTATRCGRPQR
jgi:hypothetical protein